MTDPYSPENIADTKARAFRIGLNAAVQIGKAGRKIFYIACLLGLFMLSCTNLMIYFAMPSAETAGKIIPNIWSIMVIVIKIVYYYGMYRIIRKLLGKGKKNKYRYYSQSEMNQYQEDLYRASIDNGTYKRP